MRPQAPVSPDSPALDDLARRAREAMARGDRAAAADAFEGVVERLQRRASRLAYWYLRQAEDADEVVQDTFLKTFERLAQYRPGMPFEAWFLRALVNACLDRSKAKARRGRWMVPSASVEELASRVASREPTPERRVIDAERHSALADAIGLLPDRQRTVVLLSQLDERSHAEIGEMIGLNASTVRVHLFRALRRLRNLLEGADIARASGARPR
jgi:RNA polymerase sigma-70 factor (ECF subfamily)